MTRRCRSRTLQPCLAGSVIHCTICTVTPLGPVTCKYRSPQGSVTIAVVIATPSLCRRAYSRSMSSTTRTIRRPSAVRPAVAFRPVRRESRRARRDRARAGGDFRLQRQCGAPRRPDPQRRRRPHRRPARDRLPAPQRARRAVRRALRRARDPDQRPRRPLPEHRSTDRPQPLTHLWVLAAAGAIGFIGNEIAAYIRLRAGRRLNSPPSSRTATTPARTVSSASASSSARSWSRSAPRSPTLSSGSRLPSSSSASPGTPGGRFAPARRYGGDQGLERIVHVAPPSVERLIGPSCNAT